MEHLPTETAKIYRYVTGVIGNELGTVSPAMTLEDALDAIRAEFDGETWALLEMLHGNGEWERLNLYVSCDDRWGTESAVYPTMRDAEKAARDLFGLTRQEAYDFCQETRSN